MRNIGEIYMKKKIGTAAVALTLALTAASPAHALGWDWCELLPYSCQFR